MVNSFELVKNQSLDLFFITGASLAGLFGNVKVLFEDLFYLIPIAISRLFFRPGRASVPYPSPDFGALVFGVFPQIGIKNPLRVIQLIAI